MFIQIENDPIRVDQDRVEVEFGGYLDVVQPFPKHRIVLPKTAIVHAYNRSYFEASYVNEDLASPVVSLPSPTTAGVSVVRLSRQSVVDYLPPFDAEPKRAFLLGVCPLLDAGALTLLRDACLRDDPELSQGVIVFPYLYTTDPSGIERTCAIAYCQWKWFELRDNTQVLHRYHLVIDAAEALLAPYGLKVQDFTLWFDDVTRAEALEYLPKWIDEYLQEKGE